MKILLFRQLWKINITLLMKFLSVLLIWCVLLLLLRWLLLFNGIHDCLQLVVRVAIIAVVLGILVRLLFSCLGSKLLLFIHNPIGGWVYEIGSSEGSCVQSLGRTSFGVIAYISRTGAQTLEGIDILWVTMSDLQAPKRWAP